MQVVKTFLCGNIEKNLDLTVYYKTNVFGKMYKLHFYTPMCREFISFINGSMVYSYVIMVKAL